MNFLPNIDFPAIQRGLASGTWAATSFGVQALKILSEIRDNTNRVQKTDRIRSGNATTGVTDIMKVPAGQDWTLKSVVMVGGAGLRKVVVNGTAIVAANVDAYTVVGVDFPLTANSQVSIDAAGGDYSYTLVYTVVGDTTGDKPGPFNVDYKSVDNVGVLSSIHLDGHPVNGGKI